MRYIYPCILTPEEEGGFFASFPDIPGALTCGDDRAETLELAADALVAMLAVYVQEQWDIPTPSPVADGQELVAVPPVAAAKLALYTALRTQGITWEALADRLGLSEPAVCKLLNPDHYSHISQVVKALRVSASPSAGFNVFSVLDIGETNHSAFLADLLDPNGSHRRGAVFLKHFLNLRRSELSNYGDLEGFHVDKEVPTNKYGQGDIHGRIDILLKRDDACIIIENKIKRSPKDEPNQLSKYYRYAKDKGFADKQIKLIYLTLDGREPSEESLRGEERQESLDADRVILMSYECDIVEWLENCLKEVVGIARIQDILLQYQDLVKKMTDQPVDKWHMDIIEVLTKNYNLVPELESSIPELVTDTKTYIQYKFWKKLNKRIAEICDLKRLYNGSVREVSKDYIRRYYQPDKQREYFGITFKLTRCARCELHPPFDVAFRVELEEEVEAIYYGFALLGPDKKLYTQCKQEKFKRYVDVASKALRTTDSSRYWLGYKYPEYQGQRISFSDFGAKQMRYIADDAELEKMVETIALEIKYAVDKFTEAKEDASL